MTSTMIESCHGVASVVFANLTFDLLQEKWRRAKACSMWVEHVSAGSIIMVGKLKLMRSSSAN